MAAVSRVGVSSPEVSTPDIPKTSLKITDDNWEPHHFNVAVDWCRSIQLKSDSQSSFIQAINLLGYQLGEIRIQITLNNNCYNYGSFKDYLSREGINLKLGNIDTMNAKEIKKVFNLIKPYISIKEEELQRVEDIINKGSCEAIVSY